MMTFSAKYADSSILVQLQSINGSLVSVRKKCKRT